MSATPDRRDHLAGLTLDAVLAHGRIVEPPPPPTPSETSSRRRLVDMIRDEDPDNRNVDHKDKSSWQIFRDRLRMKRAGAAWTSSVNIPASDIPILPSGKYGSKLSRRSSVRLQTSPSKNLGESTQPGDPVVISRPQFMRRTSTRLAASPVPTESTQNDDTPDISMPSEAPPARSFRPQMSRRNSTRLPSSESDEPYVDPFEGAREKNRRLAMALVKEKAISAREAVAAQEAAEAEAAAAEAEEAAGAEEAATGTDEEPDAVSEEPQAVGMSLLDLLDTMGFEEEEEEEEEESAGMESNCCVCMVRHKGAALIPCGHTFCRLCSRELRVQRGNCPLCNSFILEILDIF